jgi:hypothetical protein
MNKFGKYVVRCQFGDSADYRSNSIVVNIEGDGRFSMFTKAFDSQPQPPAESPIPTALTPVEAARLKELLHGCDISIRIDGDPETRSPEGIVTLRGIGSIHATITISNVQSEPDYDLLRDQLRVIVSPFDSDGSVSETVIVTDLSRGGHNSAERIYTMSMNWRLPELRKDEIDRRIIADVEYYIEWIRGTLAMKGLREEMREQFQAAYDKRDELKDEYMSLMRTKDFSAAYLGDVGYYPMNKSGKYVLRCQFGDSTDNRSNSIIVYIEDDGPLSMTAKAFKIDSDNHVHSEAGR